MNDRNKLLLAVHHIRDYLKANQIIGSITLVGREGMAENHLLFDAPWCKLVMEHEKGDVVGMRLKHKRTDPESELADTLGALSTLAALMGTTSLSLLDASRIFDRETGATHGPLA